MNRMKRSIISILVVGGIAILGFSIFTYIKTANYYAFIRENVKDQSITQLITEISRGRASDCYPKADETQVCRYIQYTFDSGDCIKIIQKLKVTNNSDEECRSTSVSKTYKNTNFEYSIGTKNGEPVLFVKYISKN